MAYLYDTLIEEFGKRAITKIEIPNYISDNLKRLRRTRRKKRFSVLYFFTTKIFKVNQKNHFF